MQPLGERKLFFFFIICFMYLRAKLNTWLANNLVLFLVRLLAIVSLPCALGYLHIRKDCREG